MAIALTFSGRPAVSRRWKLTARVTGLPLEAPITTYQLWMGHTAAATPPAKPSNLAAGVATFVLTHPGSTEIRTMTVPPGGLGAVQLQAVITPGYMPGLTTAKYVWLGLTTANDPNEDFAALAGPQRPAA